MLNEHDEMERIKKEKIKQEKLEEELVETTKNIVRTLKKQKKIEIEHLDLVKQHQKYWKKELEKTNDRARYNDLKNKLKQEDKIYDKIIDHIKHLDKEIEIQKAHIP